MYWPFQRENIKHNNIFSSIHILCHLEYTCKILKYTIIHSISSIHTSRHIGFKSPESGWKGVNIKYLSLCLLIFVYFLSTFGLSMTLYGTYRLILKHHRKISDRSISRNAIQLTKHKLNLFPDGGNLHPFFRRACLTELVSLPNFS